MALTNKERQAKFFQKHLKDLTPIQRVIRNIQANDPNKADLFKYTPEQQVKANTVSNYVKEAQRLAAELNQEISTSLLTRGYDISELQGYTTIRISKY